MQMPVSMIAQAPIISPRTWLTRRTSDTSVSAQPPPSVPSVLLGLVLAYCWGTLCWYWSLVSTFASQILSTSERT